MSEEQSSARIVQLESEIAALKSEIADLKAQIKEKDEMLEHCIKYELELEERLEEYEG